MVGVNEGVVLVKEDVVDLVLVYVLVEDGELDVYVDICQFFDLIIFVNYVFVGYCGVVLMCVLCNELLVLIYNSIGMG